MAYLLAIDQGTTSSRAIVFDRAGRILGRGQRELPQIFPADGWVEHNALQIWDDVIAVVKTALREARVSPTDIACCGITNQRETTVLWDRKSGQPLHNAIVWQDRRTAEVCAKLKRKERWVTQRTGLLLDPYFSATKLAWLLDHVPGARKRAEKGELAFGTIDSWLLWKLTNGKVHATDASNAARTLLFNIKTQKWDDALLKFFKIPRALLPEVRDNVADYGRTDPRLFGAAMPIGAMVGDQQAATVGQACFEKGMIKSTYGTGCFMVLNIGSKPMLSKNRLLTTVAYRLNGKTTYALEGSIFVAGAAVQWLRDAMKLIKKASECEEHAIAVPNTGGVYLVPAFTGLGAPYWDPGARGAVLGLTRDSDIHHIVRAALESVCYQTRDLLIAMQKDAVKPRELRVDGGMVVNDWLVQFLADILQIPVERPAVVETTALGAAYLAGLQCGMYKSLGQIAALWASNRRFEPKREKKEADKLYSGWLNAVERVRSV
ncbi:MAG: glycerol kinase GlpK [Nevskiales bacterium]